MVRDTLDHDPLFGDSGSAGRARLSVSCATLYNGTVGFADHEFTQPGICVYDKWCNREGANFDTNECWYIECSLRASEYTNYSGCMDLKEQASRLAAAATTALVIFFAF